MWKKKALAIGLSFACLFGASGIIAKSNEKTLIEIPVDGKDGPDTDDSRVIQEYLDRAQYGTDSGRIDLKIPAGTYYIYKQLIIHSNTNLVLDKDATIVRMDPTKGMIRSEMKKYATHDEYIGGYNQVSNIIIQGGTWDGNSTSDTISPPIMYLAHGSNVKLQNFQVKNQCSRHMVILAGINEATVSKVKLSDFVMYEGEDEDQEFFTSEGESGVTDHELSMRTMEALHLDCVSKDGLSEPSALPIDGTVNKNITVTGCTFENLKSGVGNHYMAEENPKGSGLKIEKNTFKNVEYTCIDIYNQTGATITENTATNVGEFVRAVQSNTLTVNNNKKIICNASKEGSSLTLCGIKTDNCKEIDIDTNTITRGMHGISLTNSTGKVTGNTVTKAELNGITLPEGSVIEATANTIKNVGATGIYYDKSYGTISGNIIDASKSHAIAVYASTRGKTVSITDNTITNPKEHGICVNASSATIKGNTIDNVKEHGIYALEGAEAIIEGNQIGLSEESTLGKNGIYLNSALSGSVVKANKIGKTGENGILIFKTNGSSKPKLDISGNRIENGAGGNGIRVEESNYIALKDNTMIGCRQAGIQMYHAKWVDIFDCETLQNSVEGIYAYDTSNVVVTGNKISCILPQDADAQAAKGQKVNANTANDKENDLTEADSGHPNGITAETSQRFTASGNTIEQCENGIVISGGTADRLVDNTVSSPLDRGIWVIEGAVVTNILNNKITDAGNYGIHVYEASAPLIASNPIANVGKIGIYVYGGAGTSSIIKENTIKTTSDSGIRADNIRGLTIRDNTITNTKGAAIHGFCDNTLILDNNEITGNQAEGVAIYDTVKTTIINHTINPGKKVKLQENSNGIALYNTTNADVSENKIYSENHGILLNSSFGTIGGNTIQDMAGKGIWMYDCQKYVVTVENNKITNTKAQGIHFYSSKGSVDGNTLENTAQNTKDSSVLGAIQIYKYVGNSNGRCVLKNNNIVNSGVSGIRVDESSFVDLTDNAIVTTGKAGVHLFKTSNAEITGKNTIIGNREEGIAIHDSDKVKVQGIKIGGNQDIAPNQKFNAVTVASSKEVVLLENTLDGALNAILFSKSNGEVTGNALKNVSERGIWCTDGSNVVIMGNEIPTPGTMGIHLTDSTGTIEQNNITSPKDAGIYVYGAKGNAKAISAVNKNTVTSPGSFGIKIEKSEYVAADGNILSDAKNITLNAVDSKNVSLTNSVITGNVAEGIGGFNCTSLEISGNQITPGDQIKTYADGIKLDGSGSGSAEVTVKNNTIKGARNGLNIFAVSSGTVEGNVLSNIQTKGIWVQGNETKAARMDVIGNTIPKTGKEGIHYVKATGNIKDNTIESAGGIAIYLYDGVGTDKITSVVDNNTINTPAAQAVKAENCAYLTVSNNKITAPGDRAINLAGTNNGTVTGNSVTGNVKEGIFVFGGENITAEGNSLIPGEQIKDYADAITFSNIKGAVIKANKIEGAKVGINFNTGSNGTIAGNKLKTIRNRGISVSTQCNANVDGNEITSPGENGIHFYQSTGNATNNTITNAGKNGILFFEAVSTVDAPSVIQKNIITNPKESGIRAEGSNAKEDGTPAVMADYVTIADNKISNAGARSIHLYKVDHSTISGNEITGNPAEGIYVYEGAAANVTGNNVQPGDSVANYANAITVSTIGEATVTQNNIIGAENGIVLNASKGSIANNSIQGTKANGISMTDTAANVSENTISNAGKIGIYGKGSAGTDKMVLAIDKNTIAGTGEQGLKYDGSSYLKIQENAISETTKAALNLYQTSNAQIVGNDISANKAEGIYAFEGNNIDVTENSVDPGKDTATTGTGITLSGIKNALVEKNNVNHSGKHGICITAGSSNAKVNNNTVQNSAEHGIIIDSCTEMTVDGNEIEGSGKKEITAVNNSTGSGKDNKVSVDEVYTYDSAKFPINYTVGSGVDVTVLYRDVNAGEWFVGAVQFVYDNGIMNGISADQFDPNGKLTRAQFVTVLHNMEGKPQVDYQDIFTDVPNGEWFSIPVIWAYNLKITSGIGNGLFGTKNIITREQLATMLYSYAKTKGLDTSYTAGAIDGFADRANVDSWAEEAMNWAVSHGVMNGNGAGLDPRGEANRAQCAQMIKNLKEKVK